MKRDRSRTKVIDVEATPVTVPAPSTAEPAQRSSVALPTCKVTGQVERGRKVSLKVDQSPGALLAVFGDRQDGAEPLAPGEYRIPPAFSAQTIEHLAAMFVREIPEDFEGDYKGVGLNAVLQAMSAFEPTNELEGMIAAQATAMHFVTMDSLSRAQRTDRADFRQQHLSAANKSGRTFAALVETLNRHRGKVTTQRVVVENVNVHPGGQAVVGAVAGVGSRQSGAVQTHGQSKTVAIQEDAGGEDRAALFGAQQGRQPVSAAGDEGQEALSSARRRGRNRRAQGQPKQLEARPLQRRGERAAPIHTRTVERSE